MGRDVLHGQFPFFFYGQPFMGAVDGYLHAVSFVFLGESVATLRVWAVLVSLGYVVTVACLAHRVFTAGRVGRGAGARAVAVSPQVGRRGATWRTGSLLAPHPTLPAPRFGRGRPAPTPARRTRALVVLALVGGTCAGGSTSCSLPCWWPACWRSRSGGRGSSGRRFLAPLTFLLGSAPVWLFAAVYSARGPPYRCRSPRARQIARPRARPPGERAPPGGRRAPTPP